MNRPLQHIENGRDGSGCGAVRVIHESPLPRKELAFFPLSVPPSAPTVDGFPFAYRWPDFAPPDIIVMKGLQQRALVS